MGGGGSGISGRGGQLMGSSGLHASWSFELLNMHMLADRLYKEEQR